jgi:hypothetical protein
MRKPLIACALVASAILSACLFDEDKDPETRALTLSGTLASLDTLPTVTPDSGQPTAYHRWFLAIDSADYDDISGTSCFYNGYLGDSAQATYTNPMMAGQKTAQAVRSEGLELYADTSGPDYTHYRVVFDCFD